jgi:hypothetical protein
VTWEHLTKVFQLAGAALGIPAAAAGSYSVYRTYFSTEVACQNLKTTIVAAMEKNISLDAKRALVKMEMAEFERTCTDAHAREFLTTVKAALETPAAPPSKASAPVRTAAASLPASSPLAAPPPDTPSPVQPAAVESPLRGPLAGIPFASLPPVGFSESPSGERKGWVALARRQPGRRDDINFDGFAIAETALPPAGTVLVARWPLPIWREPQGAAPNDLRVAQGRLRLRDCVRVVSARPGGDRLWAEVQPAPCP